jgi:soluble lytic murein transglycosylase-like protein
MILRPVLLAGTFLIAIGGSALAGGIPVFDAAKNTQRLQAAVQKEVDLATQAQKVGEVQEIVSKGADALGEMRSMTDELTRAAAVVQDVRASAVYAAEPGTIETSAAENSAAADVLFGKPKKSIESRIVRTALAFKDSAGVRRVGLTPFEWRALFQSLVKQESAFNPTAKSHVGAYGLTQLMPGTAGDMGVDRYNIDQNLKGGAKYITIQLKTFGRIDHALAAYNAGPGNVRKYKGIPPFKETQGYVKRITGFWKQYLAKYGSGARPDLERIGDTGDLASGGHAGTSEATAVYADHLRDEADAARKRIEAIMEKIDAAQSEKTARDLNTALKAEIAKLLGILGRLRAATAEYRASRAVVAAMDANAATQFLDWTYRR